MNKEDLLKNKNSDTVVIYGSGRSLREYNDKQWKKLSSYDTIGFNMFVIQRWITNPNYMIVGDIRPDGKNPNLLGRNIKDTCKKYLGHIDDRYDESIFILRNDQRPNFPSNYLSVLKNHHLVDKASDFGMPSTSVLYSTRSALFSGLDWALKMGYKKIIFAGVDLYDYRFFFLDKNELRAPAPPVDNPTDYARRNVAKKHPIHKKIFQGFKDFRKTLQKNKIELYSANSKSLLLELKMIKKWEI